jgi:hypothetical protein
MSDIPDLAPVYMTDSTAYIYLSVVGRNGCISKQLQDVVWLVWGFLAVRELLGVLLTVMQAPHKPRCYRGTECGLMCHSITAP